MSTAATPGPAPIAVRGLIDVALRVGSLTVELAGPLVLMRDDLDEPTRAALAHTCDLAAELSDALAAELKRLPEGHAWPA